MMKSDSGMIALQMNGEDYLAVVGGEGSSSNNTPSQPGAQYKNFNGHRCNEIHFYKISSGQYNMILFDS